MNGENIVLLAIALTTAWNTWQQRKIVQEVQANTDLTKKSAVVIEKVHTLTNSAMGVKMLDIATVTAAKAAITKDPADMEAAALAMTSYLDYVQKQGRVDAQNTPQ